VTKTSRFDTREDEDSAWNALCIEKFDEPPTNQRDDVGRMRRGCSFWTKHGNSVVALYTDPPQCMSA